MPTPPYARLLISLNGDTAVAGSRLDCDFGDEVSLRSEDTAHPQAFRFIMTYPEGFELPSGWTDTGDGVTYEYSGSHVAPTFSLPADTTWGKWTFELIIDNGNPASSGLDPAQFRDASSGVQIIDPDTGREDIAYLEGSQFDSSRPNGTGALQRNARREAGNGTVSGTPGDTGPAGPAGKVGLTYAFGTSTTTSSDPGSGNFRLNNATHASATRLALSDTDANSNGVEAYLLAQDDSTNTTVRGQVIIRSRATPATFRIFNITGASTDSSGWVEFVVTYVDGGGTLSSTESCDFIFIRSGDKGADGDDGVASAATPLGKFFVVDPGGPSSGATGAFDGSLAFKTVAAFLAAVVTNSVALTSKNNYQTAEAGGVAWTDKNIGFTGTGTAEPSSHETLLPVLKPTSTGSPLRLSLDRVSATVQPQSSNIVIVARDASVDVQGTQNANVYISGTPDTANVQSTTGSAPISGLVADGVTIGAIKVGGTATISRSVIAGNIQNGSASATIKRTNCAGYTFTFTGSPGVLHIDTESLFSGLTLVNGSIDLIDDPADVKQCWVDVSTTLPTNQQTGSRLAPFGSLQQAFDYFPDGGPGDPSYGIIRVLQGNPSPNSTNTGITSTVDAYKFLAVLAESGSNPVYAVNTGPMACGYLEPSDHVEIYLQGLHFEGITAETCRVLGRDCTIGNSSDDGGASFKFESTFPHAHGSGDEHPSLSNVTFANVQIRGYDCTGNIHSTANDGRACTIERCELRGNVTIDHGDLYIDNYSWEAARRNAKTITVSDGVLRFLDGPGRSWEVHRTVSADITPTTIFTETDGPKGYDVSIIATAPAGVTGDYKAKVSTTTNSIANSPPGDGTQPIDFVASGSGDVRTAKVALRVDNGATVTYEADIPGSNCKLDITLVPNGR